MAPRIWTGIAAPIAMVSVLLMVIAISSAWYIHNMQQSVAGLLTEHVTSMRAAQELELSVRDLRSQGVRYLITNEEDVLKPIPSLMERTKAALDHAESLATTPAEKALMRRTRAGLDKFFVKYSELTRSKLDVFTQRKLVKQIDEILSEDVIEPTREYLRLNEGMLAKANEENHRVASRLTIGLIALGMCGSIGGLLGGWVISAALRRSMLRTEERLRSTARQLDDAVRSTENTANRAGRSVDALDDVAKSASAVLDRLKQTRSEALRAEQLAWAGQMAAGIAHEVRNPLMAIKLLVQALADGRGGTRLRPRDVQVLEEEIERLEQIISSFLDYARPPRPDKKAVDVGGLAVHVAERLRSRASLQQVEIGVVAPAAPVVAALDPNQFQQVLYNLLFNSLDAMPSGGHVVVTVNEDQKAKSGGIANPANGSWKSPAAPYLHVCVEDDGPGLADAVCDRLFEPFVSTKDLGMGLGLSICRRIVESHGGEIRAANRAEGGASFDVRIPLVHPHGLAPAPNFNRLPA